jgi:hypothetical protein
MKEGMNMFDVRRTEDKIDLERLFEIMLERAKWLESINKPMWDVDQFTIEKMNEKYGHPAYYLALEDEEIVGGFLLLEDDRRRWPERVGQSAFYIHKFVVKLGCGGNDYSGRMLEWIKKYGKLKGKRYIRIDYERQIDYLRKIYLKHGFDDREIKVIDDGIDLVKAEYIIGQS